MGPGSIKEAVKGMMGPLYEPIRDYVFGPLYGLISSFWDPRENFFVLYLLGAVLIALAIYRIQYASDQSFSLSKFWRFLAPKEVYAHRSATLDYKFLIINSFVLRLLFGSTLLGSAQLLSWPTKLALQSIFGQAGPRWELTITSRVAYTILLTIMVDFAAYLAHYLQHRIPLLWQFHKTHHSAEALTPVTNYRNHPVDELTKDTSLSLFTGVLAGIFAYLYHAPVFEYTIINVSIIFFFHRFISNFYHSQIWISYGWYLNHILISPCMHQIHHSSQERHFDRNFARIFAFWDYLFGTIYVPREKEDLSYGISNNEHLAFDSVWSCYMVPFKKAAALFHQRTSQIPAQQAIKAVHDLPDNRRES